MPRSPKRTGRWYASCYLLHTWLQTRGEWGWSCGGNRTPFRDSSRAVAPKSLFDNLFVLDERSSFIFTFWRLSVEIGNEIPITFFLISLDIQHKYKTCVTAPAHIKLNESLSTLGGKGKSCAVSCILLAPLTFISIKFWLCIRKLYSLKIMLTWLNTGADFN